MQESIPFLSQKDEVLKTIIADFGLPIIQKREEGFASMCHIILEQQVSIASARAAYEKLVNLVGKVDPFTIYNATDEAVRTCGISRQKTLYLKDLAQRVISKELDFSSLPMKSEQQIRNELIQIKGVGNWSIDVYLMFCMQSQDIIPLGDIAIKNTLIELYNCQSDEEMLAISSNWKPFRTVASFIIWHYYLKKRGKI
ncbi:3-methyladenine DNA glycosylase [Flavobacterium ammoniigenes]|jgi:DNA-3-methyladenine glycosylase II|uniref:DNA-3-methyladenine glycosylase II n=1 Tax=Flavobacterium ammoniigenes TaxID=1751095 RepID=A0ABN6L1S1_9FLAO|nr:DNA-3-methyladenine glycosylase 2 family protein [Flavobacterium ammoniigenes]BDB54549.1 3-methyladenine DNA glycosylase [Flavobacterium ammoniigenes]